MSDVLVRGVPDVDVALLKEAAEDLGESMNAFVRSVLRDAARRYQLKRAVAKTKARRESKPGGATHDEAMAAIRDVRYGSESGLPYDSAP